LRAEGVTGGERWHEHTQRNDPDHVDVVRFRVAAIGVWGLGFGVGARVWGSRKVDVRRFKLPWREASAPNHHDDKVDSDQ